MTATDDALDRLGIGMLENCAAAADQKAWTVKQRQQRIGGVALAAVVRNLHRVNLQALDAARRKQSRQRCDNGVRMGVAQEQRAHARVLRQKCDGRAVGGGIVRA